MMWDGVVLGVVCFLTILLVEKFAPVTQRWMKALTAAIVTAVIVAIWLAIKPV